MRTRWQIFHDPDLHVCELIIAELASVSPQVRAPVHRMRLSVTFETDTLQQLGRAPTVNKRDFLFLFNERQPASSDSRKSDDSEGLINKSNLPSL